MHSINSSSSSSKLKGILETLSVKAEGKTLRVDEKKMQFVSGINVDKREGILSHYVFIIVPLFFSILAT